MKKPDQRAFEADIEDAEFQIGVTKGMWGFADATQLPESLVWPKVVLWVAAVQRQNAPQRYYLVLDLENYRTVAPTGPFWDMETKAALQPVKWPKGKPGSRIAKVFRTDWNVNALYHPYDRVAADSHNQHNEWKTAQPHLLLDSQDTIVDYLAEIHGLLNSGDYVGV